MNKLGRYVYDTKNNTIYDTESDDLFIKMLIAITSMNNEERFRTAHELEILLYHPKILVPNSSGWGSEWSSNISRSFIQE